MAQYRIVSLKEHIWLPILVLIISGFFQTGYVNAQDPLADGGYGDMLYPYVHQYDQTLCYKIGVHYCPSSSQPPLNADEVLDIIRKIDHISRGIPKIVYLVGWQYRGHDTGYPSFTKVNPVLKRQEDKTPQESLEWLIKEGKKYNTLVSIHLNFSDCYLDDNPLGPVYQERDILVRETDGKHRQGYPWCDHMAYRASNYRNWYQGTFRTRQMEPLFEMLPGLSGSGSIHPDAWYTTNNPYYQVNKHEDCRAMREMTVYVRKQFNVDLTTEFDWGRPEGVDFILYHPMIWHLGWNTDTPYDPMKIPSYFITGGDSYLWGGEKLTVYGKYFGFSATLEAEINEDPENMPGALGAFATRTLPWYFLNRQLRSGFNGDTAWFTGDITVTYDDGMIIRSGGDIIMESGDVFIPALWRPEKEIIAYSSKGYRERSWKLPTAWKGIAAVDLYQIGGDGLKSVEKGLKVSGGAVSLSLGTGVGLSIVPAGQDPDHKQKPAPSGKVLFIGENTRTGGDWKGRYGKDGYSIPGQKDSLPGKIHIKLLNAEEKIWRETTGDIQALQKTAGEDRIASAWQHGLHEIVEIELDEGQEKTVTLYFLDWDRNRRWNVVDAIDTKTRELLHSYNLTDFQQGIYLQYRVSGKVAFRISNVWTRRYPDSKNAVLSGIFIDE
jgi:hypothetical protein